VRTRTLLSPVLLSLALLVAACGTEEPTASSTSDAVAPTTSPPQSPSPTPEPADDAPGDGAPADEAPADQAPAGEAPADDVPPFDGSRDEQSSPGEGHGLSVVDVRVGQHDGYDRIVFELGGDGTVGWRVGYDDDPAWQGSGERVEVDGGATLRVLLDGLGYPFDTGVDEYAGPRRFSPRLASLREVRVGGVYEGYFDAFVGVQDTRPFRVFRLDRPQRVVIDVGHAG
jgi:hypothetical protein